MAKVVNNGTAFSGTVNTVPTLPIGGSITVTPNKMSASSNEVALEADVDSTLSTLFPAFSYISKNYVTPGVLTYSSIDEIPLATKTTKGGTAIVLEGTLKFTMNVTTPAVDPSNGSPDPTTSYQATVTLSPTQTVFTSA